MWVLSMPLKHSVGHRLFNLDRAERLSLGTEDCEDKKVYELLVHWNEGTSTLGRYEDQKAAEEALLDLAAGLQNGSAVWDMLKRETFTIAAETDARLIAADLLEVAQDAVNMVIWLRNTHPAIYSSADDEFLENAEAVLAKAKGAKP